MNSEKVIKALECRKNVDKRCGNPCEDTGLCHYATAVRGLDGEIYRPFICDREKICVDAITMIKEQEELINELLNLGYPHNFQHEAPWVVDYLYSLTEIIKKAFKVKEGR